MTARTSLSCRALIESGHGLEEALREESARRIDG
jgi:hypothetical protein